MHPNRALTVAVVVLALGSVAGSVPGFAQTAPDPATAESATAPGQPVLLPFVTLEECVAAARAAGANVKLAGVTLDAARAALLQARAENALTLGETAEYFHKGSIPGMGSSSVGGAGSTGGSGSNGENFQAGVSLTGPATSLGLTAHHVIEEGGSNGQVSSVSLSGSQTVFDGYPGGRAAAAVQKAETVQRISEVAYDGLMKTVVYQVRQAYYLLLGDQDIVLLRQATGRQAAENLALYQGLYTAGRATRLEVLEVQVALTQAQLDVRTSQNSVVTNRMKLSLAIGWPLEKQYSVADSPPPDRAALGSEEALKSALQNRSELLILEQDIAAAAVSLALQKSQGMPVVALNASLGMGLDWTTNVNSGTFTAGVSIALPPISDGGLRSALVQQAMDQVEAFRLQQALQGQSVTIDVANALFAVTDMRDRDNLAALNLQQAQGQYELEKAKVQAGSGTTLDVLTAFSALANARVGLAQAKSNYLLAVLNLDNAMGL